MGVKKFSLVLIFLFVIAASNTFAADFYADVNIIVSKDGSVSVSGETNHPSLQVESSQDFTSKKGPVWLLNITVDDVFSDYIYELHLPENAYVTYLKTFQLSRIMHDGGITIIGTGEEQPFSVVVQYTVGPISSSVAKFLYLGIFIVLAFLLYFGYSVYSKRKKSVAVSYSTDSLTDRQKQIVIFLEKSKKPVTQASMEKHFGWPKSSLSRNIDSLVRKGILKKESKGITNVIFFNE
jgi:uncharacterized membrane protein